MSRFYADTADNYGNSENNRSTFFQLKNDKDTARVRFMYNGMDDVEGYAVHEVEVNGKRRYVNCLREYTDPKNVCPFCAAGNFQKAKLFVPLYDVDEQEVKLWERGKRFFGDLSSLCSRYSSAEVPLVSHIFEIERRGKPKDTSTTYGIYEVHQDETTLDDVPEVPQVLGTLILDKTAEEMDYFLENEEFPEGEVKRRGSSRRDDEPIPRRTPSRRQNNDGDVY